MLTGLEVASYERAENKGRRIREQTSAKLCVTSGLAGAQAIAAPYIKAGKWHTFSGSEPIVDGMQLVPLSGHTPGQKILFWGDIVHALRVQLPHPEVTAIFDIDQTATAATRNQLLPKLAREDVLVAGPHMNFPALGRLRKEAVAIAGQWWYLPIDGTRSSEERQ
jgi:glyoxylase-like metal-dependent hydrolase (beta-lactamase superfamily II)